jgi:TrmH family RNA methyltransferase
LWSAFGKIVTSLITSRDNKLFKLWASLQTSKGIAKHELALVSGRKIVPELLAERGDGATVLVREGSSPPPPFTGKNEAEVVSLSRDLFEELDEFGTGAPLLVLPAPEIAEHNTSATADGLVIGVAAQDPSNLGAIMRSALAFDASEVVLFSECANPFLPRVTRAASGANFRLRLAKGLSIKLADASWLALDMHGEAIDGFAFPTHCKLLLGEEGLGIPDSFTGTRLSIAISPRAESLNVAVAAGVALAAYRRAHPL